jgi:PiT family inorganic phosphate transporter
VKRVSAISTTQTITSSVLGVGATRVCRGFGGRWRATSRWRGVLTIPVAALSAAAAYGLIRLVV